MTLASAALRPPLAEPTARMRIALFCGNYNYVREGANQALNRLVARAIAQGATVRVYSPVTDTPAFEPEGELVPVRSFALPGRGEFQVALGMPRAIREDVAAFAPDLVHLSTPDLLGFAAQRWARARGVPVVTSLHTRFETYFDYYGLGFVRRRIERLLARFYDRSDFVLAPTVPILDEMRPALGQRVRLWGRGVEHGWFSPERRDMAWRRAQGIADDELAILFFGRLVREKGTALFAEIVARLATEGVRCRPLVVGEGPERARMTAAMPGAVFTGHLDREALWRAVASADVMLTPSRTEAFGNVVLEAMSAGLAVVSADAPSARQIVRHGESGLLCPADDAGAYVAAVRGLAADPARRAAIGKAARATAMRYDWDAILDQALAVWKEAAGK